MDVANNLDELLELLAKITWLAFAIFFIIYFVRTLLQRGLIKALTSLFTVPVLSFLLLAIVITLISLALVFVQPQGVAVVVSLISPGGIRSQPLTSGLHWIVPVLETEIEYPIYWQTYTMSSKPGEGEQLGNDSIRARTRDGQEVLLDCSVIFRVDQTQVIRIHVDWQDRYINDFVRPIVRGYVRTEVSQFTVGEVNSSARKDLELALDRKLKDEFGNKGMILDQFILRDIAYSVEYSMAIEHKQVAWEGKQQKDYEAEQMRITAKGKADAIRIEAQARSEALELIKKALNDNVNLLNYSYIDKIAPNIKVMLLPSNNPLLLPLPDLEAQNLLSGTTTITSTVPTTTTSTGQEVTNP